MHCGELQELAEKMLKESYACVSYSDFPFQKGRNKQKF